MAKQPENKPKDPEHAADNTPSSEPVAHSDAPHAHKTPKDGLVISKKMFMIGGAVALVIIIGVVAMLTLGGKNKEDKDKKSQATGVNSVEQAGGNPQSTDPVQRGKYLSLGNCSGTGSKKLNAPVMQPTDVSVIEPYGLVAGGHVTPVDHQYYYGKDQHAAASTYNVYAPSDGTIVSVEARPKPTGNPEFRVVTSYSCTFFSYVDLVNSLSPEVAAKMPSGYETVNGPQKVKIPVKEGQVIAKIGGQSLDFAVWDTTKTLPGLLVPKAFNNKEPWKINTVLPTAYYTDSLKAQVLPLYVRSAEPRDGKLDYDVDGKAVGDWFKTGTNGYIGAFSEADYSSMTYADGHLSLAPSFLDPTGWVFSTGAVNHGTQYAIKSPSITPDKLDTASGTVKYELTGFSHTDQTGQTWLGTSVPTTIKLNTSRATTDTVLVQLTAKRELKVQLFPGKTAAQVTDFTADATTYTRGDEATTMTR